VATAPIAESVRSQEQALDPPGQLGHVAEPAFWDGVRQPD